jgi:hypothetical protein
MCQCKGPWLMAGVCVCVCVEQADPERYYEHAEQVTPDDRPLDYVRLKVCKCLRVGTSR